MARPQPALIFIFITLFLDVFGFGVVMPVLPDLVKSLQGGNLQLATSSVGWLGALFALMQFIFSPIIGSLSDQYGRRPIILASLFGSGVDYLLLAWAPTLGWLYLGRIVSGITAANFSAASAYIADVTPPEKRAGAYGLIGAAFGLGFVIGPAVGGLLGEGALRLPFVVAAGVTLLNWLYGALVLPESLKPENRRRFALADSHPLEALKNLRRWPVVVGLAATHFLGNLAGNIYPAIWVLYTGARYGWKPKDVGISLAVVGVAMAVVQGGLSSRLIRMLGERRGIYVGFIVMALAMCLYAWAREGWMIYCILPLGALAGIAGPATQSLISREIPADEQGAVQGTMNSVVSIAMVIAPLLWTQLFSVGIASHPGEGPWAPGLPFYGAALLSLLAAGVSWRAFRRADMAKQKA